MKLEIHYREIASTDGIKVHIEEKLEKLSRFLTEDDLIRVIVGAHKGVHFAEVFWHDKSTGKDLFAKKEGTDLYTQIDQVADAVWIQLEKLHEKMVSKRSKKAPLKKSVSQ